MNNEKIWFMIKMRGLGFTQKDIADKLGVTQGAIQWNLTKLKQMALKKGINAIYKEYMQVRVPLFEIEID